MAECARCGKEFVQRCREKYCSTACRGAKKRRRREARCLACGVRFEVPLSRFNYGQPKYCCAACKYAHFGLKMRKRLTKTCPVCGKDFETFPSQDNVYCSYTCMGKARERKEARLCALCGDEFRVKKSSPDICCSWECRVERLRGENHPSWKGGKLPNYAGDWVRAKRAARERDDNRCVECGKTAEENGEAMSVHHVRSYRSFDEPVEANRLENLVSLCRSCHARKPE